MALIKCPECGKEVSDKAEVCIHCGYPIAKEADAERTTEALDEKVKENSSTETTTSAVAKESASDQRSSHTDGEKADETPEQEMTNALALRSCGHNKGKCAMAIRDNNILRMNYRDSKHFINKVKRGKVNPVFNFNWDIDVLEKAKEELEALGCTLEIITMPEDEAQKLIPPKTTQEIMAEAREVQRKAESLLASSSAAGASAGPKCPTCGSTDIQKIGAVDRVVSTQVWGLSSKKINKTFKCKKCGYSW